MLTSPSGMLVEDGVQDKLIEILEEEAEYLYGIRAFLEDDNEADSDEARNVNTRLHKIDGLLVLAKAL